jgi:hypothetical protein
MADDPDKTGRFAERLKRALDKGATLVTSAREVTSAVYDSSGLRGAVDHASEILGEQGQRLDEQTGLLTKAQHVAEAASDTFDRVTGKAILDMVTAFLEEQSRYNDLLATKLDEALKRLDALEAAIRRKQ